MALEEKKSARAEAKNSEKLTKRNNLEKAATHEIYNEFDYYCKNNVDPFLQKVVELENTTSSGTEQAGCALVKKNKHASPISDLTSTA